MGENRQDLGGRVVVATGGSSGFGRSTAVRLHAEGARVDATMAEDWEKLAAFVEGK